MNPSSLPIVNGTWSNSSYEFRHRSTTSTHEYYDIWNTSTNSWDGSLNLHNIKVGIVASASDYNTWTDAGSSTPNGVDDNADGYVYLYNTVSDMNAGTPLKYSFLKPTSADWISGGGGGGTSTEGFSYSGSLLFVPSVPDLVYTIPQSSSAGTYTIYSYDAGTPTLELTRNHTTQSIYGSLGPVPNFDPSNTHKLLSPMGDVLDTYSPAGVKKVHCNFW